MLKRKKVHCSLAEFRRHHHKKWFGRDREASETLKEATIFQSSLVVFRTPPQECLVFCFICHIYPPFTRKRIVSLYEVTVFGEKIITALWSGLAAFPLLVFVRKARVALLVPHCDNNVNFSFLICSKNFAETYAIHHGRLWAQRQQVFRFWVLLFISTLALLYS